MRDRLIELIAKSNLVLVDGGIHPDTHQAQEALADYLIANCVIVPPCKVGDTVYVLTTDSPTGIEQTKISQVVVRVKGNCKMSYTILAPCVYDDWGKAKWSFCDNDFGKTVFLTKEEAEKALAERGEV